MTKMLVMLSALMVASAHADSINSITWETFSSDDKMYVCNAGIRHQNGTRGHVDPNSGGMNSGNTASTHDYLTADFADLNNDMVLSNHQSSVVKEANEGDFNALFSTADAFSKRVAKVFARKFVSKANGETGFEPTTAFIF